MMSTEMGEDSEIVHPEDVLPDGRDRAIFQGISVRKGTVAAFIKNAQLWSDPDVESDQREALATDLKSMLPSLRALGVMTVFEVRDAQLRALLADA